MPAARWLAQESMTTLSISAWATKAKKDSANRKESLNRAIIRRRSKRSRTRGRKIAKTSAAPNAFAAV